MLVPRLALCFQQVPRTDAAGYSRSNRKPPILPSTALLSTGSRSGNFQQLRSNPAGVTCPYPPDAVGGVLLGRSAFLLFTDVNTPRPPRKGLWDGSRRRTDH
jgi:hypothetical protein